MPPPKKDKIESLEQKLRRLEERVAELEGSSAPPAEEANPMPFEILAVDGKTISRDEENASFSWVLTVRSNADRALNVDVRIKLVDLNSRPLEEASALGVVLEPGRLQELTGVHDLPNSTEAAVMGVKGYLTLAS